MNVQRSKPSRLFSLRLMFEHSKLESLRDVDVTRNSDTLSLGFSQTVFSCFLVYVLSGAWFGYCLSRFFQKFELSLPPPSHLLKEEN